MHNDLIVSTAAGEHGRITATLTVELHCTDRTGGEVVGDAVDREVILIRRGRCREAVGTTSSHDTQRTAYLRNQVSNPQVDVGIRATAGVGLDVECVARVDVQVDPFTVGSRLAAADELLVRVVDLQVDVAVGVGEQGFDRKDTIGRGRDLEPLAGGVDRVAVESGLSDASQVDGRDFSLEVGVDRVVSQAVVGQAQRVGLAGDDFHRKRRTRDAAAGRLPLGREVVIRR